MLLFLGLLDILAGIGLALFRFGVAKTIFLTLTIIIIIKSLLFFYDFSSFVDLWAGLMMIFALLGSFTIWTWLAVIWLLQKGLFSIIGSRF